MTRTRRSRLVALLRDRPGGSRMDQVMWAASGSEAIQKALWAALSGTCWVRAGCAGSSGVLIVSGSGRGRWPAQGDCYYPAFVPPAPSPSSP